MKANMVKMKYVKLKAISWIILFTLFIFVGFGPSTLIDAASFKIKKHTSSSKAESDTLSSDSTAPGPIFDDTPIKPNKNKNKKNGSKKSDSSNTKKQQNTKTKKKSK